MRGLHVYCVYVYVCGEHGAGGLKIRGKNGKKENFSLCAAAAVVVVGAGVWYIKIGKYMLYIGRRV
jgi:hypothetical protein